MSPRRLPETQPLLGTLTARDILDELSTRNLKPSLGNRSGGAAAFNVLAMVAEFKAEHDGRQHCGGKNEPRYRNGAVDRWTPRIRSITQSTVSLGAAIGNSCRRGPLLCPTVGPAAPQPWS
jgi:hypothetical protein